MDLDRLLTEIADLLDHRQCEWALIGGMALAAYGIGRPTADVDFVVEGGRQDDIVAALEASDFETVHRSRGYSNHLRQQDRVDLVYVRGSTATTLWAESRSIALPRRQMRVVRPEHLAAMKLLAMKNDPGRAPTELADLRALLRLPETDHAMIEEQMRRYGFDQLYDQLNDTT